MYFSINGLQLKHTLNRIVCILTKREMHEILGYFLHLIYVNQIDKKLVCKLYYSRLTNVHEFPDNGLAC
jgi:hypothetical protein